MWKCTLEPFLGDLELKYKVIACGVFEPYLKHLAAGCPNQIDVCALDAGLHSRPNDLRLLVQTEIDNVSRVGGFDAVILLYGLCGRGTANLISRDVPIVMARAHDCIALFLGSSEAYLRQFSKNPGTFYHTLGWIEKKINPGNREASQFYTNYARDGWDKHPDFSSEAKFGKENAEHVGLVYGALAAALYTRGLYRHGLPWRGRACGVHPRNGQCVRVEPRGNRRRFRAASADARGRLER